MRDQCHTWDSSDHLQPADNATVECTAWEYDRSQFKNTLNQVGVILF